MTLAFFTNFINHHQIELADALYKILGKNYVFVAFHPLPETFKKTGYPDFDRPYLLKAYESVESFNNAKSLMYNADVAIIGSAPAKLAVKRISHNKVTFHYNERWFKNGFKVFLKPHILLNKLLYHTRFRNKKLFMLCASAYTKNDTSKLFAYPKKCFRWGYFTQVPKEVPRSRPVSNSIINLMWCARFINWKHPEMMVSLTEYLLNNHVKIHVDMYGNGPLFDTVKTYIEINPSLKDTITLHGNVTNDRILYEMQKHDIFLFTSDKNEGWGAVVNEAMSSGCAVIASDGAGSTNFLIKSGVNGISFKSKDQDDLNHKTLQLIKNPSLIQAISIEAYQTMQNIWNGEVAANRLINLIQAIQKDSSYNLYEYGPASLINK